MSAMRCAYSRQRLATQYRQLVAPLETTNLLQINWIEGHALHADPNRHQRPRYQGIEAVLVHAQVAARNPQPSETGRRASSWEAELSE